MKFLTIRQPWASLIAVGAKTIETRPFSTKYRGPLAIHAGLSPAPHHSVWFKPDGTVKVNECAGRSMILRGHQEPGRTRYEHEPMAWGAVVAVCDLVDVLPIVEFEHHDSTEEMVFGRPPCVLAHAGREGLHGLELVDDEAYRDLNAEMLFGNYEHGRFAWLLDNVRPVDPVPMKGAQGLRDLPAEIELRLAGADR